MKIRKASCLRFTICVNNSEHLYSLVEQGKICDYVSS